MVPSRTASRRSRTIEVIAGSPGPAHWARRNGSRAGWVFAATLAADTDERRVFAQEQQAARPVARHLVHQPPLTPQHLVKIDHAEQVRLQGGVGGQTGGGGLGHGPKRLAESSGCEQRTS